MAQIEEDMEHNTISTKKRHTINVQNENNTREFNQSWDFTPFPKFLFPNEKNYFIKKYNKLNFPGVKSSLSYHKNKKDKKFQIFIEEIKGNPTQKRAPAYTFGAPRSDVKIPFYDFHEKISPPVGSYNLRPLEGLNYSVPKNICLRGNKNPHIFKTLETNIGPGFYHHNKCDINNQGNYYLSNYSNTPTSNFGKLKEERGKDLSFLYKNNIITGPGRYNVNNYSRNEDYPLGTFCHSISKILPKIKFFANIPKKNKIGPGQYNHYSIFIGGRYSK